MKMTHRHGDVGIAKLKKAPARSGRRNLKHATLAEGELTGHSHRATGDFKLYERDGNLYLSVGKKGASVVHQEHAQIDLPRGTYQIIQQREWSPLGNRRVLD